jgi:predicted transposase YbfD/YdcC
MKKQIVNLIAAIGSLVLLSAMSANAQTQGKLVAHIPFDFYVQNQKFEAGDYIVESVSKQSSQTNLVIRQKDGDAKKLVMMLPKVVRNNGRDTQAVMAFNRYGEDYFLSEIRNPSESFGAQLPRSRAEKKLARQFGKPEREIIAMNIQR